MNNEYFTISVNRPLSDEERTLLEWLIANCNDKSRTYEDQLKDVHVCGICSCGCSTLDLAIGERRDRTTGPSSVLVMASGASPEGTKVEVILHARDNQLSELEVIAVEEAVTFTLPRPSDLEIDGTPTNGWC